MMNQLGEVVWSALSNGHVADIRMVEHLVEGLEAKLYADRGYISQDLKNRLKEQGIDLKLDISVNNSVSKTYDLNFTINGTYTEIEDFIRKVQEDNTLVFKIENFELVQ